MNISRIGFEPFDQTNDQNLAFAVTIARHNNLWVFVKHKQRDTFELPGGRREPGEPILDTARRELYEETGALKFDLRPIDVYSVHFHDRDTSYGLLCYAHVQELGPLPQSEIERVCLLEEIPTTVTYPKIQPVLFEHVRAVIDI